MEPDTPQPEEARESILARRVPFGLLVVALVVAVSTPFATAATWGSATTWPSESTNFSATALAFLLALAWDRRQRAALDRKEAEAEILQEAKHKHAEQLHRDTEARRRFSAIALELERLEGSLQRTVDEQHHYKYFFPDLPSGSWRAGSGALGMIIENYGLMADLSTFYGQVEELQWRLRFKAEPGVDEAGVSPIIEALARELRSDVVVLLAHVKRQVAHPEVTRVEEGDAGGHVVARRQMTSAIRLRGASPGQATVESP